MPSQGQLPLNTFVIFLLHPPIRPVNLRLVTCSRVRHGDRTRLRRIHQKGQQKRSRDLSPARFSERTWSTLPSRAGTDSHARSPGFSFFQYRRGHPRSQFLPRAIMWGRIARFNRAQVWSLCRETIVRIRKDFRRVYRFALRTQREITFHTVMDSKSLFPFAAVPIPPVPV